MKARLRVWVRDGSWVRERLIPCEVLTVGTDGARVQYHDQAGELVEVSVLCDELEPAELPEVAR